MGDLEENLRGLQMETLLDKLSQPKDQCGMEESRAEQVS